MTRYDGLPRFNSLTSSSASTTTSNSTDSAKSSTATVRQSSSLRRPRPSRLNTETASFISNDERQISPTTNVSHLVHSPTTFGGGPRRNSQPVGDSSHYHRDPYLDNYRDHHTHDYSRNDANRDDIDPANAHITRIPQIQHNPPTAVPGSSAQFPPWMAPSNNNNNNNHGGSGSGGNNNNSLSTSFLNDSSDNLSNGSQLSPSFRPLSLRADQMSIGSGTLLGRDSPDLDLYDTHRRPSQASIATASSQGSSMNRGGFRKLQGFFGEEFPGRDSFEATATGPGSGPGTGTGTGTGSGSGAGPVNAAARDARPRSFSQGRVHRDRNHSNATDHTRDVSPSSSRPRTPAPEVVPFLYQDQDDIARYGEAPVRDVMSGPDRDRYMSDGSVQVPPKTSSSNRSGIIHHGHRHNRSNEDPTALKPTTSRDEPASSASSIAPRDRSQRDRGGSAATIYSSKSRAQSPAPSSVFGRDGPSSPGNNSVAAAAAPPVTTTTSNTGTTGHTKRGVLRRLIHGKSKEDKEAAAAAAAAQSSSHRLHQVPSNRSLQPKTSRQDITRAQVSPGYAASFYTPAPSSNSVFSKTTDIFDSYDMKQKQQSAPFNNKFPFAKKPRTGQLYDDESIGPMDRKGTGSGTGTAFYLDTDLGDMSGVISSDESNMLARNDREYHHYHNNNNNNSHNHSNNNINNNSLSRQTTLVGSASINGGGGANDKPGGSWNAPDSWAVRRTLAAKEAAEVGRTLGTEEKVVSYCIRIFRADGGFFTLSLPLRATASDVVNQLIKKTHLNDNSDNYSIVLKTHDLFRILKANESPLALQKRLLEQAGYTERDRIPDIGREDNSYLCQFMFISAVDPLFSKSGIDPGLTRITKPAHIDLSGRNIPTIPIPLFKRTDDIVSLNLSRNLALEIPRDFIASCYHLRDVKFNNNEIRRLPSSFSRAVKLTCLEVANNFIETLDGAELEDLTGLLKLSFANNRLTALPTYFANYKMLRSLNLSSNSLDKFPDFICQLENLIDLDVSFNAIGELPPDIGQLKYLERFLITNNQLTGGLPTALCGMENLRELDCKYNLLDSIEATTQLVRLETLSADHNQISKFRGHFAMLRSLRLNSNPLTQFELDGEVMTLKVVNLSNAKLTSIEKSYVYMPMLERLNLDKNILSMLHPQISKLSRLEHLSVACNKLSELPPQIGCLLELRTLDVHSNNLMKLPAEIWWANKLEILNVSSNVLDSFPKPSSKPPRPWEESGAGSGLMAAPSFDQTLNKSASSPSLMAALNLEVMDRRPSQVSSSSSAATLLSVGQGPVSPGADRKGSMVSVYGKGRNTKVISRNPSQSTLNAGSGSASAASGLLSSSLTSRKDSGLILRLQNTFAGSLRTLYLADNHVDEDVFQSLMLLAELRCLNLSYNDIGDMPQRVFKSWPQMTDLYMSRNDLTTFPADELGDSSMLQVLYLNGNKFTNLPADLARARKLAVLDCGSNWLKYNISNVRYDWNWFVNPELRYLNLSGNKRMEIKQTGTIPDSHQAYSDFTTLPNLRVLGLMDVTLTLTASGVPDQNEDCRVRTSGSSAGHLPYGMADTLGRAEHLSTMDMVVPRFNGADTELLLGLFDGQPMANGGGSKVAKYLHENFAHTFASEMKTVLQRKTESPLDALRRSFLTLNRDLINAGLQSAAADDRGGVGSGMAAAHRIAPASLSSATPGLVMGPAELKSGAVATVAYVQGSSLYVANVGDVQTMLISDSGYRMLTVKHDPAEESERARIRESGGWVSRNGKLNDMLGVSRAFGYHELMPSVMAAPHTCHVQLSDHDDVVLLATRDLWEYLDAKLVVDIYRSERQDLMLASQKLRDLAMAHGASGKLMVMMISVAKIKKHLARSRTTRGQSMGRPPSMLPDELLSARRPRKAKGDVLDSTLQRLEAEIPAPTGTVAIVFTDIKNSTTLWEMHSSAMRSAIKLHNEVMRRQLRRIGGYEVKTEGDAFMVSFPTATSALLWCFSIQNLLLEVSWPPELLESASGHEVFDKDGQMIFKGLSVRMGIHFGECVSEIDPVTRRMDYFGPMVNKAARVSGVADGGQITVSSDFIQEIQRCMESFIKKRSIPDGGGFDNDDDMDDDDMDYDDETYAAATYKDLQTLSAQGFEVKDMGERKLKGLENPELIYSLYPHALAGRIQYYQHTEAGAATNSADSSTPGAAIAAAAAKPITVVSMVPGGTLPFDPEMIWAVWHVSLRLEMLCSALEDAAMTCPPAPLRLMPPETGVLDRLRQRGGEFSEAIMLAFMAHQISRIESCVTALALRHVAAGCGPIRALAELGGPVAGVLADVARQLEEVQRYRALYGALPEP